MNDPQPLDLIKNSLESEIDYSYLIAQIEE